MKSLFKKSPQTEEEKALKKAKKEAKKIRKRLSNAGLILGLLIGWVTRPSIPLFGGKISLGEYFNNFGAMSGNSLDARIIQDTTTNLIVFAIIGVVVGKTAAFVFNKYKDKLIPVEAVAKKSENSDE